MRQLSRAIGASIVMASMIGVQPVRAQDAVIRVDQSSPAGGDGTSWPLAINSLDDALELASLIFDPDGGIETIEIWVKSDTYVPDGLLPDGSTPADPREDAFRLAHGTTVYGGFIGSEDERPERDPELNPTILSGERGGSGWEDNHYTVVDARLPAIGADEQVFGLNGLVIRDGSATGRIDVVTDESDRPRWMGGGIYSDFGEGAGDGRLVVARCRLTENRAKSGGGLYYQVRLQSAGGLESRIAYVLSSVFDANETIPFDFTGALQDDYQGFGVYGGAGAMVSVAGTPARFVNCTFHDNIAADADAEDPGLSFNNNGGAAILSNAADLVVLGSTIVENSTLGENVKGGGVVARFGFGQGSLVMRNSILWGNTDTNTETAAAWTEQILRLDTTGDLCVNDSLVEDYDFPGPGGGGFEDCAAPGALRILTGDPEFLTGLPPYELSPCSPCVDFGTTILDAVPGLGITALVDVTDVDDDGDALELVPDLLMQSRRMGSGAALPDLGAIEVQLSCPADFDVDRQVGFEDLLLLLAEWGPCPIGGDCLADLDDDGDVDFEDLLDLLAAWGACPGWESCPGLILDDYGSVEKCIERVGFGDPEKLATCIEAMMLMGTP